ncbi:MAG: MFS transporter [Acidimicrobiaceae bacterium]|nr:MFS transporter [Acidimicrobiaceae bacterium]
MSARDVTGRIMAALRHAIGEGARTGGRRLELHLGGPQRTYVIAMLAAVLALSSADTATVGASATQLRAALHIDNTDIGLLVAVNAAVGAVFSLPFGFLADRFRRTTLLSASVFLWGGAMLWSATASSFDRLLLARLALGVVTAVAGPVVASLIGDYFPSTERGRIYGYVLTGELVGAGFGFAVTGDIAALSWRLAFVILAIPTFILARFLLRLPEPIRGGLAPLYPQDPTHPRAGAPAPNAPPAHGPVDQTMVFPAQPGLPPYLDPSGRLDPRFPAPGYTDPRRDEVSGGYDSRYLSAGSAAPGREQPAPGGGDPTGPTDAQRLAKERGIGPDDKQAALLANNKGLVPTVRHLLAIRTNRVLIVASALGYFYLAGIQTFAIEFTKEQYGINQAVANLLLLVVGVGSVVGVLVSGPLSDRLLQGGRLNARIGTTAVMAAITVVFFIPALITRSATTAVPYVTFAALALAAQNPPIDAARLDIVPARLWGRAEGLRTALRTAAQSLAPITFGGLADLFGGQRSGLQLAFLLMLIPLAGNAYVLFRAMRSYPADVATAAAANTLAGVGTTRPREGATTVAQPAWPAPADRVQGWPEPSGPRSGPTWRPSGESWDPGLPRAGREGTERK